MHHQRLHVDRAHAAVALFATAVILLLSFASTSSAANVGSMSADRTKFTFLDNSGATNTIKVTYSAFTLFVEETATGTVTASTGCTQVNSKKISCPTTTLLDIDMDMGALVDKLTMGTTALIPPHVTTTVKNVGAVTGGDGPMTIYATDGGTGNVVGGSSYDNIYVTDVAKTILGGAKDDQITIKNSIVTPPNIETSYSVDGGTGADMIDASDSTASLMYFSSQGTDVVLGSQSADEFQFGHDRDLIFGNDGDDRFYGQYAGDQAEADLSEIWGGNGNDVFTDMAPQTAEVTHFEGGPGSDKVVYFTGSGETERPNVKITFDDLADDGAILFGDESEGDHFHLSVEDIGNHAQLNDANQMGGNDQLFGSDKPNRIFGHNGYDYIEGGAGDDYLDGGSHDDIVDGGAGDDTISNVSDTIDNFDTSAGGEGDDLFIAVGDGDSIDGGTGLNEVSYAQTTEVDKVIDLATGSGSDTLVSIQNATGSTGADDFLGSDEPNVFDGIGGDDEFAVAGGGVDRITCGAGADSVIADANDVIVDPAECEVVDIV